MSEEENEQIYEQLLLGTHVPALVPDEIGVCVICTKDITYVDDYVTNIIFIKRGNSGSTHTEHYHLKCWKDGR